MNSNKQNISPYLGEPLSFSTKKKKHNIFFSQSGLVSGSVIHLDPPSLPVSLSLCGLRDRRVTATHREERAPGRTAAQQSAAVAHVRLLLMLAEELPAVYDPIPAEAGPQARHHVGTRAPSASVQLRIGRSAATPHLWLGQQRSAPLAVLCSAPTPTPPWLQPATSATSRVPNHPYSTLAALAGMAQSSVGFGAPREEVGKPGLAGSRDWPLVHFASASTAGPTRTQGAAKAQPGEARRLQPDRGSARTAL